MIKYFTRIGGREMIQSATFPGQGRPWSPFFSHVQTDGSFTKKAAATAVLLRKSDNTILQKLVPIQAESSTEAEWVSVFHGLTFALEHNEQIIALENDDFGVISALITQRALKHEYAKHYRNQIVKLVGSSEWTGVRWIPREYNKADDIFLR
jgi:ribonuclease HI